MSIFPKRLTLNFPQNFEILLSLTSFEKDLHMILNNVLNGKKGFFDNNISFKHSKKISIFPKGLTHDFPQKFEISGDLDMMMNNVLNRKNGFLDYKNVILK